VASKFYTDPKPIAFDFIKLHGTIILFKIGYNGSYNAFYAIPNAIARGLINIDEMNYDQNNVHIHFPTNQCK